MTKFTIKDIAKLANVSTATVSYFLNGNYSKMSLNTRRKLADIIARTNYLPSTTARNLAKSENKTIGVSVADITNPFTSPVISAISERCEQYGYKMVFTDSNNDEQRERENINRLRQEEVAGLIIDPVNPEGEFYNQLSNRYTVVVDRQSKRNLLDTIITDNLQSVKTMTEKMVAKDYDDLYFVTWPLGEISTRLHRYEGFKMATKYLDDDHLLTIPYNYDLTTDASFKDQVAKILQDSGRKVGFFSMNSRVLQELLLVTQSLSYDFGKDFGVATYEEIGWMNLLKPGISCIRQDSVTIGYSAMDILKDKLEADSADEPKPQVKVVPTKLIIKDSF